MRSLMFVGLILFGNVAVGAEKLSLTNAEANMLQNVNRERVARGLNALEIDWDLQKGTRRHAEWMASYRIMQHASGYQENIAQGQPDSGSAHRTWMNSPPHRGNILSRGVTKLGVSGYTSPEGRHYWCLRVSR
jgi:uncharacterized protein YkwD